MPVTKEELERDLQILRHGGADAVALFMEMGTRFYEADGEEALASWVTLALPALPDVERAEIVTALFDTVLAAGRRRYAS
jgi:hypothetical protein